MLWEEIKHYLISEHGVIMHPLGWFIKMIWQHANVMAVGGDYQVTYLKMSVNNYQNNYHKMYWKHPNVI